MRRSGRKRKPGRRHPSGQLIDEHRPDDRQRVALQPHRRGLPKEARLSELAESALGRLFLRGALTLGPEHQDEQAKMRYDAGERFRAVVGAYRAVIEAPSGTAGSGHGFGCAVERTGSANACGGNPDDCLCLRRQQRYEAAFAALGHAGRAAAMAVKRVCILGEEVQGEGRINLVAGLDVLARHFGLTGGRAVRHYQNAN